MSADLIRILLNPYNTNLTYRYESQDVGRNLPAVSRQITEGGESKNPAKADEEREKSQIEKQKSRDLQKKKFDNKLEEEIRLQKRQLLEKRIINNARGW